MNQAQTTLPQDVNKLAPTADPSTWHGQIVNAPRSFTPNTTVSNHLPFIGLALILAVLIIALVLTRAMFVRVAKRA